MYEDPLHQPPTPLYEVAPDGHNIILSRRAVIIIGATFVALSLIVMFFLGRITANRPILVTTRTVTTPIHIAATPQAPHISAAWNGNPGACATAICEGFDFTALSPFYLVSSCTLAYTPADAPATLTIQIFNGNNALINTIMYGCGGTNEPSLGTNAANILDQKLPPGTYALNMTSENDPVMVSVTAIAA
jgi:hypothetical protein